MGESFALWNWRSVVDFRLLSGVRPKIFYVLRQVPLSAHAPRVGEKAPAFTLADQNGNPVALGDLLSGSRAVVLIFYRGFW